MEVTWYCFIPITIYQYTMKKWMAFFFKWMHIRLSKRNWISFPSIHYLKFTAKLVSNIYNWFFMYYKYKSVVSTNLIHKTHRLFSYFIIKPRGEVTSMIYQNINNKNISFLRWSLVFEKKNLSLENHWGQYPANTLTF